MSKSVELLPPGGEAQPIWPHLFLTQRFDLLHQRIDFVRRQFARILRHMSFAVGDDVHQFVVRCRRDFGIHQRRPAKVASLGGLAMALRTVFLINRVRRQGCLPLLGKGWSQSEKETGEY